MKEIMVVYVPMPKVKNIGQEVFTGDITELKDNFIILIVEEDGRERVEVEVKYRNNI